MDASINVLGGVLQPCSTKPMSGFFRNGCCDTRNAVGAPDDTRGRLRPDEANAHTATGALIPGCGS